MVTWVSLEQLSSVDLISRSVIAAPNGVVNRLWKYAETFMIIPVFLSEQQMKIEIELTNMRPR